MPKNARPSAFIADRNEPLNAGRLYIDEHPHIGALDQPDGFA
jgi:hypothetical protein